MQKKRTFKTWLDLARYRSSMAGELLRSGCKVDGNETTEELEEMTKANRREAI